MPVTFETWANATTFVCSVMRATASSAVQVPSSATGTQRSVAPVSAASSCHGTRFAWCSASVTRTSSPGPMRKRSAAAPPRPRLALAMPYATRFSASVAFAVQTTSDGEAAPTNPATVARASS